MGGWEIGSIGWKEAGVASVSIVCGRLQPSFRRSLSCWLRTKEWVREPVE